VNLTDTLDDFKSIELSITLKNALTQVAIKDPKLIQLVELGEKSIRLDIPPGSFASGHLIGIEIEVRNTPKGFPNLTLEGKIVEHNKAPAKGEPDQILIELTQYGTEQWAALLELYSARQNEILKFFSAVRGYE
jgi:hypothetical protein